MSAMAKRERLRRVVLLCSSFARNLAYYRVGHSEYAKHLLSATATHASFWRQANANFLDVAVLEWCKLLGDRKGEHHWRQIVSDPARFEAGLLGQLEMDAKAFADWTGEMRRYRDKFIAHLDSDTTMQIPLLDAAHGSVWFYHAYVAVHEAQTGDLVGLPDTADKFNAGYAQCVSEAQAVFQRAG